jgi:hypothetical protein
MRDHPGLYSSTRDPAALPPVAAVERKHWELSSAGYRPLRSLPDLGSSGYQRGYIDPDRPIRVRRELTLHAMAQVIQEDSHSFAARKFERRHQVTISSDHHNRFHRMGQRKSCDVQPNPQINALLRNGGYQILRLDEPRLTQKAAESSISELPSSRVCLAQGPPPCPP